MRKKIFYGWWIVFSCFLNNIYIAGVVFAGFTAFFQPIREEFGWSYAQISLAASFRGMEMSVFAPIVGYLVDRFGARTLILLGTLTVGLGLVLFSQIQSLLMYYVSCLVVAFGAGGCAAVVTTTAVANWFQRRMGLAIGIAGSGAGIAGIMVPVIVYLIDVYQWRTTLLILGLAMWIVGIPLSMIIRNRPEDYGYLLDGDEERNDPSLSVKPQIREPRMRFREIVKKKAFVYLNLAEIIRFTAFSAISLHIMPYLTSVGVSRNKAGWVAAAIPVIGIPGRFLFGWFGDRHSKRYALLWGYLMISAGLLALSYAHMGLMLAAFLILFSPGNGAAMVLRASILREYYGRESFGKLIGTLMGSSSLGGVIGPFLAGWAFDLFGTYTYIWLFDFVIVGLASLLIWKVDSAGSRS